MEDALDGLPTPRAFDEALEELARPRQVGGELLGMALHGDDQPVQFTGVLGCEWHRGREFDHGHDQFLRALQSASLAAERPGDGSSQLSGRPVQGCGRERGGSGSHTTGDIRRDRGCYRGFGKRGSEQIAYGSFDRSVVRASAG